VTIHDIARLARVSPATVSKVLNNREGVGNETRARVRAVVEELDYRVSVVAQNLATRRSQAIGLVFPLLASELVMHPVLWQLIGAVGDVVSEQGYSLTLITVPALDRNQRVLGEVQAGRLDGIILPDVRAGDDIIERLAERDFPAVVVGSRDLVNGTAWVDCDHDQAVYELATLLLDEGHERVALMNGPEELSACALRRAGYQRALEAAGIGVREELLRTGPFDAEYGRTQLKELLDLPEGRRPTAIVAGSDLIAAGCLDAARDYGLQVPGDLALTGFDDQPLAAFLHPPLTTARMPITDMGRAAAEMLLRRIAGEEVRPASIVFPTEVVVRASSGSGGRWAP
jgi:LacI family transcriptional regulator